MLTEVLTGSAVTDTSVSEGHRYRREIHRYSFLFDFLRMSE